MLPLPPLPPFPLLPSSFDEANKKFINQWRRGGTYFHFCRQQKQTSLWDNFSAKFSIVYPLRYQEVTAHYLHNLPQFDKMLQL